MRHAARTVDVLPLALVLMTLAAGPQAGPIADCNSNGVADDVETQVTFADHFLTSDGGVYAMQAADIDGDLDTDVVFPIRWCENLGDGVFAPCQASLGGPSWSRVFSADMDEDDDLDLLATQVNGDWVAWFENLDGAGSFGTANFIRADADAASVFAADLDGDGDNDAVWASGPGGDLDDVIQWEEHKTGKVFY